MTVTVQLMFNEDNILKPLTNAKCKYCGQPFYRPNKYLKYCSDRCRELALKEQKAEYQRRRRRRIRDGELVANDQYKAFLGTQFLSQHRQEDFKDEHEAIIKEMKRLKLRR